MPSLATFNANNFFLRYRFNITYPEDLSRHSCIEGIFHFTGAVQAFPGCVPDINGGIQGLAGIIRYC